MSDFYKKQKQYKKQLKEGNVDNNIFNTKLKTIGIHK